jgi:acetyl-CoA acetyltransferase
LREVFVIGIGMTAFGRFLDRPLASLAEEAVRLALSDAAAVESQIEAIAFANATQGAMEGQYGIRGQVALQAMAFDAVPIINVENACASASTAFNVAMMQIQSGSVEVALAVGAEKMVSVDTALSMAAFEGSWDRAKKAATLERLAVLGKEMPTPPEEAVRESPHTVFMDIYSAFAKYHMGRFGTTQRHLAEVAAKNHRHSIHNPLSQYRKAFSADEVLAARLMEAGAIQRTSRYTFRAVRRKRPIRLPGSARRILMSSSVMMRRRSARSSRARILVSLISATAAPWRRAGQPP